MTSLVRASRLVGTLEGSLAAAALGAMALLPALEIALRATLHVGVPGSILVVQHLTLVVTFLGAALAARGSRLLALSTTFDMHVDFFMSISMNTGASAGRGAGTLCWGRRGYAVPTAVAHTAVSLRPGRAV